MDAINRRLPPNPSANPVKRTVRAGVTEARSTQVATAEFPQNYLRARTAILECQSVDEVATWANKSAAMACYARQLQDRAMLDAANRIHARALERIGELLKQVQGTNTEKAKFAQSHGVSGTKFRQAIAIADIPQVARDRMIERTPAPVPSEWTHKRDRHGLPGSRKSSAEITGDELRDGLEKALVYAINNHARMCRDYCPDPASVARHLGRWPKMTAADERHVTQLRENVRYLIEWLDGLEEHLPPPHLDPAAPERQCEAQPQ